MKLVALNKKDQNEAWVDPWSAVHFSVGLAFGLVGIHFWKTVAAAIAWDIFEQVAERASWGQKFFRTSGPESWGNVGTDTALFLGGWYLGQRYNATGPAVNPETKPRGKSKRNPGRILRARKGKPEPRGMRQRQGQVYPSLRDSVVGTIEPIDFGLR